MTFCYRTDELDEAADTQSAVEQIQKPKKRKGGPHKPSIAPNIDAPLWSRAVDIWGVCRGLGWTLDSERAVKRIYEHLREATEFSESRVTKALAHTATLQKQIVNLKKSISQQKRMEKLQGAEIRRLRELLKIREKEANAERNAHLRADEKSSGRQRTGADHELRHAAGCNG